ncbi:3D domain-containing protein [Oceanobacillus polygoni]|uniref:3D (Asp-Asp-Asp) domain-containing protein/peptidoglycan hydrolase CwlO-like protein n=1 Tax=Oceanobacillus polygoni TaxID=1235259 RepID=A0A9X0YSI6_9BACI|nr:3D domain-containing protein [Oceanobacillus polygoni]MBP2078047.1 3D (Asp-Asp-Asp) domain-containing protein/peptidoglycan hydrolase CwlO-like protein [Oceanobacillus polygoni]
MKRTLAKLIAVMMIVGLSCSFFSIPTFADSTNELDKIREQRATIKENLTEAESEIADVIIELETLSKEIERVDTALQENQKLLSETENKVDGTLEEISILEEEMKELEKKIEERYEILKGRIVSTQQSGGKISYLEVIFGSQSFGDFISRVSAVNTIANSDAALIEQQEADIQLVAKKQATVFDKLDQLNALKLKQEETQTLIAQQLEQNKEQKSSLEQKQNQLAALADELQIEDSTLASLEGDVKQQIAKEKEQREIELAQAKEEAKAKEQEVAKPAKTEVASAQEKSADKGKIVQLAKEDKKEEKKVVEKKEPKKESEKKEQASDGKTFTVTSTAYTVKSAGGSGITSTGINLNKNPNAKVIAVDPSVIPLGSIVDVEGYGHAIAGDIGSAIKGKKIDVFVPTQADAYNWGVRTVKVTIVK